MIEYLWTTSRSFYTADDPAAENRVAATVLAILAGYLRGHADYLRYDTALQQGWSIATA
jgi:hypothetical protein